MPSRDLDARPDRPRDGEAPRAPETAPRSPAADVVALQRTAGNRAVAAMLSRVPGPVAPPTPDPRAIASEEHTVAEIEAMTLEEFHSYTERQADWRTTPAMTADAAKADALRALLEFSEGGKSTRAGAPAPPVLRACGAFSVSDLLAHATDDERRNLRAYSDAFAQTRQTVEVELAPDIAKALAWGDAIVQLEAAIPLPSLRLTTKQKSGRTDLQNLIDGRGWRGGPGGNQVANYVDFVTRARPLLQADNGEEIVAYLGLAATVNPADYVGQIQHVRNLHHFEAAALDKLKDNWTNGNTSNLPFTLVLHSGMDNNGAFHHDPNMTAAIVNTNNFTLMIEGARTLSEISGLLPDLAARYGVGGKIQQAMIAGHGESRSMELAGGEGSRPGEIRSEDLDLDTNPRRTEALFSTLLANMDNGPQARILINGCLTASHRPLDTLPAGERAAALAIRNQAQREPAIADRLRDMARAKGFGDDTVSAANASFTSDATLIDPATGQLRLGAPGYDPQLTTADRLDYVREGGEPEGALRAVLELWGLADHPAAGGRPALGAVAPSAGGAPAHTMAELEAAMRARVAAGGTRWDDHLIVTLYNLILTDLTNAQRINALAQVRVVRFLSEIKSQDDQHVHMLYALPFEYVDDIFTGLSAATEWTEHRLRIVMYHKWAVRTAAHQVDLLEELSHFTCQELGDMVDFRALDAWGLTGPLLDAATATTATARSGQLRLALMEAIRNGSGMHANALTLLRTERGAGPGWPDVGKIRTALGGASTADEILDAIREPEPDPGGGGGGGGGAAGAPRGRDFNVDLDQDDVNDLFVDPMPRQGATAASLLNVRERPGMQHPVIDTFPRGTQVILIGRVGRWYAIEHGGTTAFVHSNYVRLTPNP